MISVKEAFRRADENGDGTISKEELKRVFRLLNTWTDEEFEVLWAEADKNEDDKLQYDEFLDWVFKSDDDSNSKFHFFDLVKSKKGCLPMVGDNVVCFESIHWQRQGKVIDVREEVSDGSRGLKEGVKGTVVTVQADDDGERFETWGVFLAPLNDMEYSSVCTSEEYQSSNFFRLHSNASHLVTKDEARQSLQQWLQNLVDAENQPVEVDEAFQEALLHTFDQKNNTSLHLYSGTHKLTNQNTKRKGRDYSVYYKALNNTLNHDTEVNLQSAMPLLNRMKYLLLYDDKNDTKRFHVGGTVYKGDGRPVPLNMQKLREARDNNKVIYFRQFQSTSSDREMAEEFQQAEKGYLWTIDIPEGFLGARDIRDISDNQDEDETLFPPYSAFLVKSVDNNECHLMAVDQADYKC